jgi:hypothetical protein
VSTEDTETTENKGFPRFLYLTLRVPTGLANAFFSVLFRAFRGPISEFRIMRMVNELGGSAWSGIRPGAAREILPANSIGGWCSLASSPSAVPAIQNCL